VTADVRIRSIPPADEGCPFLPCLLFPLQSAILCFPPHTLTRAHRMQCFPAGPLRGPVSRSRSCVVDVLAGGAYGLSRAGTAPARMSCARCAWTWSSGSTRWCAVVPPCLRRADASRCVSRQCSAEQRHENVLRHAHTPPADETCAFLLHPVSSLLSTILSLPPRPLTRTPSEGTLPRRIFARPRSSNSFLRGERRSPATRTGSVRPRRASARTPHARFGRISGGTAWCAVLCPLSRGTRADA
jgi:hypothetical protein